MAMWLAESQFQQQHRSRLGTSKKSLQNPTATAAIANCPRKFSTTNFAMKKYYNCY